MMEDLQQLEALFSDRYTDKDDEFMKTWNIPLAAPPCVENWYSRPKRQWDWTRGRGQGRGRGSYDNRDRGYHQQRGRHHGNHYGHSQSYRGHDNRHSQSHRGHDNRHSQSHRSHHDNYRLEDRSYDNRYHHNEGERKYNQNRGSYNGPRDNYGQWQREGEQVRSGPSRTLYPGKKETSRYGDRHHPYGQKEHKSHQPESGPPQGGASN